MYPVCFELVCGTATLPDVATEFSAGRDAVACLLDDAGQGRVVAMRNECNVATSFTATRTELLPDWGVSIPPHWRALIPLGFRAAMHPDLECQVRPRSGLAWKHGISVANTPGTIDVDYPDEWMVILENRSTGNFRVQHGDRIAQLVFALRTPIRWQPGIVSVSTDRVGGLGSTGV